MSNFTDFYINKISKECMYRHMAEKNTTTAKAAKPVNRQKKNQTFYYYKKKRSQQKKKVEPLKPVKVSFLGGINEVGKNMTVFEYDGDMIIVDCGLAFPDEDMLGIDLVIPDFSYITSNVDRVKGIVITHGHEDHIGALAYLLKSCNVPVYSTRLTNGLIEGKLREHGLLEKAKLNVKQGYEKAYAALEVLAPSHFGENMDYLLDGDDKDSSGNYVFFRYVNGIEFADNSVRISVDMASGKIISYRIGYDDIEFPSADGVISAENAGKSLFEQVGYDVWYIPTYEDDKPAKALLVYDTDSYDLTLDAFSGELKYKGESEKVGEYTDIENHYAKDAIEALAKFGIGFADSEFRPDSNITQADFVTLLNAAFNNHGPIVIYKGISYEDIYDDAIADGIVKEDEYSPDADVTRDLAAKMMVRALGFEEVATLNGIYVPIFADVSADSVGFTSILGAMGVIKGDENGNFNPNGTVTRADAAIMLYNYLSK